MVYLGLFRPGKLRCVDSSPYEHYGRFSFGDLDGFPPLLPLKSLYQSLKLILSGLIVLNLTLRLPYLLLGLKRIIYGLILPNLTLRLPYFVSPLRMTLGPRAGVLFCPGGPILRPHWVPGGPVRQ